MANSSLNGNHGDIINVKSSTILFQRGFCAGRGFANANANANANERRYP
jgi:hypothetical protein